MSLNHTVRLIEGTFDARDALQIIDTLLEAKINFHNSKSFSHDIRGTEDRVGCSQRIAELREARRKFAEYISSLPQDAPHLRIEGKIALVPAELPVEA